MGPPSFLPYTHTKKKNKRTSIETFLHTHTHTDTHDKSIYFSWVN